MTGRQRTRPQLAAASVLVALGLGCTSAAAVLAVNAGPDRIEASYLGSSTSNAATAPAHSDPVPLPAFSAADQALGAPVAGGVPTTLRLPRLDAPVPVDPVGVTNDGGMQIPDDPSRAGWWAGGAGPGDAEGSVVLVGHLDSISQGLGAFRALLDLKQGDVVQLTDSAGRVVTYAVTGRQQVLKSALPADLFDQGGHPRLVLVTCGGTFDRTTHHYQDNVVVVAEPQPGV